MQDSPISTKLLVGSIIFASTILALLFIKNFYQNRTKIVVCNVGQGDAIYVRVKNAFDILIDAGPNDSVLTCLGKHQPFYDHTIELAIITNSDLDHFYGFIPVLARYNVKNIIMPAHNKESVRFQTLLASIYKEQAQVTFPTAGNTYNILGAKLTFYWPTQEFISKNITSHTASPMYENPLTNLGYTGRDENEFSYIFLYEENEFQALFTGDAVPDTLKDVIKVKGFDHVRDIDLLKVPHHGSKNGLTYELLSLADPTLSVISVGSKNRYGHPSPEVIAYFKALKKRYLRTDEEGDIVVWVN